MILALDGSSGGATLVLLATESGDVVDFALTYGTGELASRCAAMVDGKPVTAVGAVCGPGTYTGTRIAIAAATGFASATGIPVFGVSSMDVAVACLELAGMEEGKDARTGSTSSTGSTGELPHVCPPDGITKAASASVGQVALAVREAGRDRFFVGLVSEPGMGTIACDRIHLLSTDMLGQWQGPMAGDFGQDGWHGKKAASLARAGAMAHADEGFFRLPVVQQFGPTKPDSLAAVLASHNSAPETANPAVGRAVALGSARDQDGGGS